MPLKSTSSARPLIRSISRLAQWEGQSRKYYYVQRATGHSQWDVPTQPALSVPTPDPTPQQHTDPFSKPAQNEGLQAERSTPLRDEHGNVVETDRSLLGVSQRCLVNNMWWRMLTENLVT